ncbi:hypothetical protein [Asanoa siamensis]|uniref:hypothetical protein n=1 Tax=Asanoa siamensis TaxID=926357 RepID=UPI0019450D57|nr:hypothetical protein [Asanoa siamensis]
MPFEKQCARPSPKLLSALGVVAFDERLDTSVRSEAATTDLLIRATPARQLGLQVEGAMAGHRRAVDDEAGCAAHLSKLTHSDPDGPPLSRLTSSGIWLITAQQPSAGTTMRRNGPLVVAVEQVPEGLAGDREPRRPLPRSDRVGAALPQKSGR